VHRMANVHAYQTTTPNERKDRRTPDQLRAIECEHGPLNRADGSVRYAQGLTAVFAAVFGPLPTSYHNEKIDRATVEVQFQPAAGTAQNFDVSAAAVIRQSLESVILLKLHPRTKIQVIIQVLKDDGSLLAVALNAACLALQDAGIGCNGLLSSVCVTLGCSGTQSQLDPTLAEQKLAESILTFAFLHSPATKLAGSSMITCDTRGIFHSDDLYFSMYDRSETACKHIVAFFNKSLEKKLLAGA